MIPEEYLKVGEHLRYVGNAVIRNGFDEAYRELENPECPDSRFSACNN